MSLPQDTILGRTLFLLYICDLTNIVITSALVNISNPEPHEAVCYLEIKKKTGKRSSVEQNGHSRNQKKDLIFEGYQQACHLQIPKIFY